MQKINKIKVTVDKSHLFTLGEKMYRESIEFIRELVTNAYDADATIVKVDISDNQVVIKDNGGGMNEKILEQFFTIGSEEKKIRNVSPKFRRKRIGQFGIGKFSALALADQFVVESVRGKYKYSVIFDRFDWGNTGDWELPIIKEIATPLDEEGTKMILNKLNKKISLAEAEKYLKKSVPLRAKKFSVLLNNKRISARDVPGKIIPIKVNTMYGLIEGQIILALNKQDVEEAGVECRVKEVFIKRDLFELNKKYHQGISRITGYVNADFLPLISARSDFITDSPEYKVFKQIMTAELEKVLKDLKKQKDSQNIAKITKELQDVMKQIRESLSINSDFVPQGKAISRLKKEGRKKMAVASANFSSKTDNNSEEEKNKEESDKNKEEAVKDEQRNEKKKDKKVDVEPLAMKKIRIKKLGISCGIASLGEKGPEVISQGNAIYINQDHPLYQRVYKKRDMFSMHLLRLVTQEIVLMKKLRITASEAFEWQGKLLTDAMSDKF